MASDQFAVKGGIALGGALTAAWSASAQAELGLNMPRGVTSISQQVYDLHMLIFWICVAIGVVVFGVMFWSIYHHRKSLGAVPAQFHESTLVEVVWTVIPMLILIGMAVPATKTLVGMYDARDAELTVKITGYQWRWQYDYIDQNVSLLSVLSTPSAQIRNAAAKGEHHGIGCDDALAHRRREAQAVRALRRAWHPALGGDGRGPAKPALAHRKLHAGCAQACEPGTK